MEYKIVFSDIDGTLLNKERELSPFTIKIIKEVKKQLPIVLISARMPQAMHHLQEQLDIRELPIIAYNGGLILVNDKPINSVEIPLDTLKKIHNFNSKNKLDLHLSLYYHDEWYVPEFDFWAEREENNTKISPQVKPNAEVIEKWTSESKAPHKIMAMGDEEKIDQLSDFLKNNFSEELNFYRSNKNYLEIADKKISKFSAIQHLLENHYKLTTEDTIAFGDNYNDVEMVGGVGMGIAVSNARQEVKDVATQVTGHGKEDGVAQSLQKLFSL
ncbi:HAD family hydrolase [Zunongwangia sp.]|uniref:HAD family hydrolase n=1 Tax=Zunongwangia sp. TaxID=1965325 RepID=UPI003AA7E520